MNIVTATTFLKSQISEIWLKKANLATLLIPTYNIVVAIRSSESLSHASVRPEVDLVLQCGLEGRTSGFPRNNRHFSDSTGKHTQAKECSGWR